MIQLTEEFVVELRVFMSETKKLLQLHDTSIEDIKEDEKEKAALVQNLMQRMYQIETRLDLKSKGTASQMSYSPEKIKDMLDGLLLRESKREDELIIMRREMRNAIWSGLAATVAAVTAGWWLSTQLRPAKAESSQPQAIIRLCRDNNYEA
jgi:hypothetical protein